MAQGIADAFKPLAQAAVTLVTAAAKPDAYFFRIGNVAGVVHATNPEEADRLVVQKFGPSRAHSVLKIEGDGTPGVFDWEDFSDD